MTNAPTTHQIDANGKTLGRLATEIAVLLRGKNKPGFTFHQDHGDKVIVVNAEKVRLTGRKEAQKMYYRHSTYPGGLSKMSFLQLRQEQPERIIEQAVKGMLPVNRLRPLWLKKLTVKRGQTENVEAKTTEVTNG
jgi:large subunit ribosomal protein L13